MFANKDKLNIALEVSQGGLENSLKKEIFYRPLLVTFKLYEVYTHEL